MELLAALYVAGIGLYFWKTTPRQREDNLLIIWALMLVPIGIAFVRLLAAP